MERNYLLPRDAAAARQVDVAEDGQRTSCVVDVVVLHPALTLWSAARYLTNGESKRIHIHTIGSCCEADPQLLDLIFS